MIAVESEPRFNNSHRPVLTADYTVNNIRVVVAYFCDADALREAWSMSDAGGRVEYVFVSDRRSNTLSKSFFPIPVQMNARFF